MPAFIDTPNTTVDSEFLVVSGWVAGPTAAATMVTVNGIAIGHRAVERPDVRDALSGFAYTSGVIAMADLRHLAPARHLDIMISINQDRERQQVEVSDALHRRWVDDAAMRASARAFCKARLRCPSCRSDRLDHGTGAITCRACGAIFPQTGSAFNMISAPLAMEANIVATENVSANPYTPAVLDLIGRMTNAGGVVLDCGAGSRPQRTTGVINVEIVDYASTDVLAIGEALPFADNSFDAAISLAVLEHVRDPFKCAQELLRVVKPGGELLVDVPFLQPVHGFPHHYYNMSAQGLANLFAGHSEVLSCTVPPHGHPIFGVQWLLRDYLAGLPAAVAPGFGAMTVDELVALDVPAFLGDARAHGLDQEGQSPIACLNSLHIRKK
ncbi:MAG: methyltransferase domain-containing protein [Acidiphilium sp.]|nr:methyltransferase domain-containing protein [Acidiphilium sp.]